jgi:serine O-acetyltransferase
MSLALKGLIDATLLQETKIQALEEALAKLNGGSSTSLATSAEDSAAMRELDAIKRWLKE